MGRHLVSAAGDERRVRVSYARTTRLSFTTDGPALAEGDPPARVPRMAVSAAPEIELRSRAARTLFGAGFGLLAVAAGVGLYATAAHSHSAAVAAQATAVGGAAAFLSGGLVVALTPAGAVMQGSF